MNLQQSSVQPVLVNHMWQSEVAIALQLLPVLTCVQALKPPDHHTLLTTLC
jgi:hypothetical protein